MNNEVFRKLSPLVEAVEAARDDLNEANRDDQTHPLESLALAGRVIKTYETFTNAMWDLLDAAGEDITDEMQLRIQGRVRAADELRHS